MSIPDSDPRPRGRCAMCHQLFAGYKRGLYEMCDVCLAWMRWHAD